MNNIVRNYIPYVLVVLGLPIALLIIGSLSHQPYSGTAILNATLVAGLGMLANDGLASYFPRENLATRSMATLIEQHVLIGLVFAGTMTLFFSATQTGPSRELGEILRSFAVMAVFFGGGSFVASILERRTLLNGELNS